jgi:hypothetical protein
MDAIEAVLELAKERDAIADELDTYEEWFESLVGRTATLALKRKQHTRFVQCEVASFVQGEGWELKSTETDEVYEVTFEDFFSGKVRLN